MRAGKCGQPQKPVNDTESGSRAADSTSTTNGAIPRSQRRAELYLFLITFVWGSTFVITKDLLEGNSPLWYTAIRFILSALVLLLVFPRRILQSDRSSFRHGLVLGALLYIGFITQTIGIQYTTASKSAFFTGLLTVLTPLVQVAFRRWKKRPPRAVTLGNGLGVIFATLGLYFMTSPEGAGFNFGDALTIICALCFAVYIVYLDDVSGTTETIRVTFYQFLFCAVIGLAAAGALESIHLEVTASFVAAMAYLIIFATVITMAIQVRYQGETTPTRAGIIFAMEPVVAGVLAYIVRNETLTAVGIAGAIIVVIGLLLSELSGIHPLLKREIIRGGAIAEGAGTPA